MKLVFSSAIFAAAVTSASATCAIRGNNAASIIMGENGCFPDPTDGASSSDDCNDPNRAAAICERFISINYDEWCYGGFPSLSSLQDQCWDRVQLLEVESVGEDDEDEKDTDAEDTPVLADTYLRARRARCGKYTAGTAAAQAGVNIVNKLWLDSGKDCRYATRQFSGDVQSALNAEFPNNCSDTGAFDANRAGRQAGENFMNQRIINPCSQPVPRPTNPPRPSRCTRGNRDFDSGVRLTQNLRISCSFIDFGDIAIQEELAKRNADSCVRRGAYDEFNRIKDGCGRGSTGGKSGKSTEKAEVLKAE